MTFLKILGDAAKFAFCLSSGDVSFSEFNTLSCESLDVSLAHSPSRFLLLALAFLGTR